MSEKDAVIIEEKGKEESKPTPHAEEQSTDENEEQPIQQADALEEVVEPEFLEPQEKTALIEVTIDLGKAKPLVFQPPTYFNTVRDFISREVPKSEMPAALSNIVQPIKRLATESNFFYTKASAIYTLYLITLGQGLIKAKKLVKETKGDWTKWMDDNFKHKSSIRALQYYMSMARISGVENHPVLGRNCLTMLSSILTARNSKDPIGDFLTKYNISFKAKMDAETAIKQLQFDVKVAAFLERLSKKGIEEVDKKKVRDLVDAKINLQKQHIETLQNVQRAGGQVNTILAYMLEHRGALPAEQEKTFAPKHFNDMGVRMSKVIESFMADEVLLKEADKKIVDKLIGLLTSMNEKLESADEPTS